MRNMNRKIKEQSEAIEYAVSVAFILGTIITLLVTGIVALFS